jgi:DNA polymerase-3 subunit alpha
MAEKLFTHLHIHTEYSLLDGAIRLDQLIKRAQECQMQSVAVTDHGNIFGAVKFFELCKKAKIKPILGMETYFAPNVNVRVVDEKYYHLLLIVQNTAGYHNLCKLISRAHTDGFYFKPRIDFRMLEEHQEGLIVSTACAGGYIPSLLLNNQVEQARKHIEWFLTIFGPERFYFEVQPEDQPEQTVVNNCLYKLAEEYPIKVIATTDAHYLTPDYHHAHEVMLCIQTHHKIDDPDRMTFGSCRPWMRTTDEMLRAFVGHEETLWNTQEIVNRCDFSFKTGTLFFPSFSIPTQQSPEEFFKNLCLIGFQKLIRDEEIPAGLEKNYQERLDLEVELIIKMGFVGYFLIVSDFIQWARHNDIPVGPGRGSAAGSLVAWALEITKIDPIKYNLLFERFLNPERISMPDIDIDFCIEGRERVIQYIRDKYGHDKVCSIITFGTMAAKGVLKDVARVLGLPFEDANAITDLVPDQLKISLKEALEKEPRLQELKKNNPKIEELFDLAFRLEGVTRHASKHAAGIVICPQPVDSLLPVYIPPKTDDLVTQYAMTELELLGFLKIDFLGLKNLTLIDRVLKLVKKIRGHDIDVEKIAFDDPVTFKLICEGKTSGVFQLESDGLKDVLWRLKPEKFEDIIAVNALYRPGPLGSGMVDDFIKRRHGQQTITYLFPELKPVLQETYGVIVYQEQVMKIASTIGGYSLGEADILRRAMGKKKADVMAQQKEIFVKRATERNFDAKKAGELFDLMAYFAGYGFNKSHSAAYAKIAYQTAYLKANYTAEFMACLISLEVNDVDKMAFYLAEAKDLGITTQPPTINKSDIMFSVVDNNLLFGLQGIKNVGETALVTILQERDKRPFVDLLDFCTRVDLRTVNKRVLENLIAAGAFDCLPGNRAQKYAELDAILERATAKKRELETGQLGLFHTATIQKQEQELYQFQPLPEWSDKEKLQREKEVANFYLSAHPLDSYTAIIKQVDCTPLANFSTILQQTTHSEPLITSYGMIRSQRIIFTKKGDRMAFVQLEDRTGTAEIILFPRLFTAIEPWIADYTVFAVKGTLDLTSPNKCKIKATAFVPLELLFQSWPSFSALTVTIPMHWTKEQCAQLPTTLTKGNLPLFLAYEENNKKLKIATKYKVTLNTTLLEKLQTLGACVVVGL